MAVLVVAVLLLGLLGLPARAAVGRVRPGERGVVFRLGRVRERTVRPGLVLLVPYADRLRRVDLSDVTVTLPYQGRSADGQRVRIEAALTFHVADPVAATLNVGNHGLAISHLGLVVLRTEAERRGYEELTAGHEDLRLALLREVEPAAAGWGVELDRVEVRSVLRAGPSAPEPTVH